MDDRLGKIEVVPDHFGPPVPAENGIEGRDSARTECSHSSPSHQWEARKAVTAASLLKLFSLPRLSWVAGNDSNDKVEMNIAEVESFKSKIAEAEERELYLKAKIEHIDGILRSARLAGYLDIRNRWTELPGEPPIIDDFDVDDWLPRFAVLHGSCIFYYFQSTDLSPQDTILLSDVVEVGLLPSFTRKKQKHYAFYILTCQGLRCECSSVSKIQVDSWLTALQVDCNLGQDSAARNLSKSQ